MSDIKYTAEGQCVQVIASLPGGKFLVAGQVGSYEDDEIWFDTDHPRTVAKVFDKAPVKIHEARVAELMEQIGSLESRQAQLQNLLQSAERTHKERLAKLSKYDCLQRIEDFIDGKITHYVVSSSYYYNEEGHYSLRITTPQAEKSEPSNKWSKKLRLLALYGDPERNLEWVLHHYSDGSGGNDACVWPCISLESAQARAREIFDAACAIQLRRGDKCRRADELKKSAEKIGAPVPEWVDIAVRESTLTYALHRKAEAQKTLDLINAELAALQS